MSKRKDELRALLTGTPAVGEPQGAVPTDAPAPVFPAPAEASPRERTGSGAIRAMGLSLGNLAREAEEAKLLRESLANGNSIVEIDPALIDPAFVSDRLSHGADGDETFDTLRASIEAHGQQVPILVRPHPEAAKAASGHYQAAYGHRRIAATASLGRKVRALVRPLSDEELVIAQGKENSERRDLSFIERAQFAHALIARDFPRAVVQAALSLHKAEMTRLLQVADGVPLHIARAIGPAPRAGRTRWLALAEFLKTDAGRVKAQEEIGLPRFRDAGSDERFQLLFNRLSRKRSAAAEKSSQIKHFDGQVLVTFRSANARPTMEFDAGPEFATFVAKELPALYAAFLAKVERGPTQT